jgi:hypothetical protein
VCLDTRPKLLHPKAQARERPRCGRGGYGGGEEAGAPEGGVAIGQLGDLKGPFILGFPWWLSVTVVVVFAALLWYVFDGRVRPIVRLPLVAVLAPACLLAAVVVAAALSAVLSGPYEEPPEQRPERTATTTTTPVPSTGPTTTGTPTASPTASPSPSPTASPAASPSPSPSPSP